jgi:exosome complex component RRP42
MVVKMNKEYIGQLISKNMREDGRDLLEYRKPIKVEYGISSKSSEGSARVLIGETEVVAGVKMELGEPFSDTPDDGVLMVGAELLPLSNPEFESGPPDVQAVELARVVDRGIRESNSIDTKKLCVKSGEKVWMIFLDIYPINDAGNLFDAAALAGIAALKDTKFPFYDKKEDKIDYHKKSKDPLPLLDEPIECTVLKIKNGFIVDPTIEEEKAMDARLTVAITKDNHICALQKGGEVPITIEDVDKMIDIATQKTKELRKVLQ